MKKLLLACSIFLFGSQFINAQTLSAGDIAFIGYDTDNNDGFTFIALAPIPGGEVIYFTDRGWDGTTSSWFNISEDNLEWTAPLAGVACGGIVNITETGSDVFSTTSGAVVLSTGSSIWSMSGGDQIIAYRSGSGVFPASPIFITAIHGDYNSSAYDNVTTWNNVNSTTASAQSTVPTGLTNGVNCISLFPAPGPELDNNKYTGSLVGTADAVRAMIHNPANWFGTNEVTIGRLPIFPEDYSATVTCSTLGVNENNFENEFTIYPNPTEGEFSIDLGQNYPNTTIIITDLLGKIIQTKRYNNSQLINLNIKKSKGIYLLIIESGYKKAVIRLVKE